MDCLVLKGINIFLLLYYYESWYMQYCIRPTDVSGDSSCAIRFQTLHLSTPLRP